MCEEAKTTNVRDLAELAPEDMRGIAESLAGELEFMQATLEALKDHINEHGPVEWYRNGKQECWRESPAMKSYTSLIPRFNATVKALVALLPSDVAEDKGDELDQWLRANRA